MVVWQPGMRCVCVQRFDLSSLRGPRIVGPNVGTVYTVRDAQPSRISGKTVLRLCEISNAHVVGQVLRLGLAGLRLESEPGFCASHFRPLDESRLDAFRKHLTSVPLPAEPA